MTLYNALQQITTITSDVLWQTGSLKNNYNNNKTKKPQLNRIVSMKYIIKFIYLDPQSTCSAILDRRCRFESD